MHRFLLTHKPLLVGAAIVSLAIALSLIAFVPGRSAGQLAACTDFAYSTEEDFITQGPVPADGNPLISDGDLLGRNHAVCMRNAQLLSTFNVRVDLGLDAVDVVSVERELVVFSTELNSPLGNFTHGDLLTTHGAVIPNQALLHRFGVGDLNLGLDGIQFIGNLSAIVSLLDEARTIGRDGYLKEPALFAQQLQRRNIDLWFSVEGTRLSAVAASILDGDLLSARDGSIVVHQKTLLPNGVPAGIPERGVDFGLDAVALPRSGDRAGIRFSTEILYRGEQLSFNDGDILRLGAGIEIPAADLYAPFEPRANFLGTDALHMRFEEPKLEREGFLPLLLRRLRRP